MKRYKVYYNPTLNNNEGGYTPPSTDCPIEYIGWVNPLVFGITMKPNDIWTFHTKLPFVNEIEVTTADTANLQTIINNAPNYTRIIFRANGGLPTTYNVRQVLRPSGEKIVHLFGEKDSLGRNLITIDPTVQITSWTPSGALWVTTLPNNPASVEPVDYVTQDNGYFYDLPFNLIIDGVPFDPVADTATVQADPNNKFYYNDTTRELWIGINPSGRTILWSDSFTFFSSGSLGTESSNPADNCILEGFNLICFGGSNQHGSVLGGRIGFWGASKNYRPMLRWVYKDINVDWCRSGALRGKFGSHIINCKVTNSGSGVVTAGQIGQTSWDNGFRNPSIHEQSLINYYGAYCGWIMANDNVNRKLNRTWNTYHFECVGFKQGETNVRGLKANINGEWFDNCYMFLMKNCKYLFCQDSGVFVEISQHGLIEDCEFIEFNANLNSTNNSAGIYNSSSNYMVYRNNKFVVISTAGSTKARPFFIRQDDRGTGYTGAGSNWSDKPLGEWRSKFVTFENNFIEYLGTNGKLQISDSRTDALSPSYKRYLAGEVIIRNNTYKGATGNRYWAGGGAMSLATFQSLTDMNNNPTNWEQGTVLI